MALAANTTRRARAFPAGGAEGEAVNAAEIYGGAYLAAGGPSHATATTRGRYLPWASTINQIPMGFARTRETGATAAVPAPTAKVNPEPVVIERLAVTGASALGDFGKKVYASDDGTFTLTRPAVGIPVGFVLNWVSATLCDVAFFGAHELAILAMAGAGKGILGPFAVSGIVAGSGYSMGAAAAGFVAPCHGLITSVHGYLAALLVGAGADLQYNFRIANTVTTGGNLQFLLADVTGAIKDASAVTAANRFHAGDLIQLYVTMATASTAGIAVIWAEYEKEIGL